MFISNLVEKFIKIQYKSLSTNPKLHPNPLTVKFIGEDARRQLPRRGIFWPLFGGCKKIKSLKLSSSKIAPCTMVLFFNTFVSVLSNAEFITLRTILAIGKDTFEGALLSLRQFLLTESPLKMP